MPIGKNLIEALENEIKGTNIKELEKASETLSARYLGENWSLGPNEKFAYAICRMPATYAVLERLNLNYGTILDLGSGPGTASFVYPSVTTCIEQDPAFIKLAKNLGANGLWIQSDFRKAKLTPHDAVLFSYSLGEVWPIPMERFWNAAKEALIIVEPGTPRGYEIILEAREKLISLGGYVVAPCPHNNACPLIRPDWCHFGVTVPRTALHRRLKKGTLGYEEEKFSYLIVTRKEEEHKARILTHPDKHPGHVKLKLCTEEGLEMRTISRKEGSLYKEIRKKVWGDSI